MNACPLMETLVVGSVAREVVECVGAWKGAWKETPEKYPANFSRRYARKCASGLARQATNKFGTRVLIEAICLCPGRDSNPHGVAPKGF